MKNVCRDYFYLKCGFNKKNNNYNRKGHFASFEAEVPNWRYYWLDWGGVASQSNEIGHSWMNANPGGIRHQDLTLCWGGGASTHLPFTNSEIEAIFEQDLMALTQADKPMVLIEAILEDVKQQGLEQGLEQGPRTRPRTGHCRRHCSGKTRVRQETLELSRVLAWKSGYSSGFAFERCDGHHPGDFTRWRAKSRRSKATDRLLSSKI